MNRLTLVKLSACVLLLPDVVCAQGRLLLAEGDYVALAKSGDKTISHWKLWRFDSGEYEVIDSSVQSASAIQTFRFDSRFMPIGFSKQSSPRDLHDSRLPKMPEYEITCEYKVKELICETTLKDGTRFSQTVPAVLPYVGRVAQRLNR